MTARVVFFDVGQTLLHDDPPVPEVFTRVARRMGHDVSIGDVIPAMAKVDEYYQDAYRRDGDFWCVHERAVQLWLDMYAILADSCGITRDVPALTQAVYDEYLLPQNWSAYPDVAPCLEDLQRRGTRMGIVSNWDATLEGLVEGLGLGRYFDVVVASGAVGCRKPDPEIFRIALDRMGADPRDAVHVGDLPEADGEGASAAGIRPVIVDRKGRIDDVRFDLVRSLAELPALIG